MARTKGAKDKRQRTRKSGLIYKKSEVSTTQTIRALYGRNKSKIKAAYEETSDILKITPYQMFKQDVKSRMGANNISATEAAKKLFNSRRFTSQQTHDVKNLLKMIKEEPGLEKTIIEEVNLTKKGTGEPRKTLRKEDFGIITDEERARGNVSYRINGHTLEGRYNPREHTFDWTLISPTGTRNVIMVI